MLPILFAESHIVNSHVCNIAPTHLCKKIRFKERILSYLDLKISFKERILSELEAASEWCAFVSLFNWSIHQDTDPFVSILSINNNMLPFLFKIHISGVLSPSYSRFQMKSCLSKPEMFCPPLIYSKLVWKTCTFIPNKHHFRRWLISEITFSHQKFFQN